MSGPHKNHRSHIITPEIDVDAGIARLHSDRRSRQLPCMLTALVIDRGPDRKETEQSKERKRKIEKKAELVVAATHPPFI